MVSAESEASGHAAIRTTAMNAMGAGYDRLGQTMKDKALSKMSGRQSKRDLDMKRAAKSMIGCHVRCP